MRKTPGLIVAGAILLTPSLVLAGNATAGDTPAATPQSVEDDQGVRVRGDRGQGAFSMSMMQMTRQFRDGGERLAFRNAFNTVVENREREKGIRQAYENGELSEADYERQRERVYRSMHGMTVEDILAEAEADE